MSRSFLIIMRQFKVTNRFTNRNTVNQYINDVSRFRPIPADEEAELARKIKAGNKKAKDTLIKANLRFVVSVAKQYQYQGLPLADLINEGNIGLIRASELFDETYGFKFISYAIWWIRQSILQAISAYGKAVRLPCNQINLSHKIYTTIAVYEQEHNCQPTEEEIADILQIKVSIVRDIMYANNRAASFDAPLTNDSEETLMSTLATEDKENNTDSLRYDIDRLFKSIQCKPREKEILYHYYGIGTTAMSYAQIAEMYGLTRERVRQICSKLIVKLQENSNIIK